MVHHADRDMDVTTAVRFHPVEIALSMLLKIGLIYLLGPSAVAVVLFEIILNGTAMFNHSNLRLPLPVDRILRREPHIICVGGHGWPRESQAQIVENLGSDSTTNNFVFSIVCFLRRPLGKRCFGLCGGSVSTKTARGANL